MERKLSKDSQKGFTLIELIVVIFIVALTTSASMVYYRSGDRGFSLIRSAYLVAQGLRSAQELAISAKEFGESGVPSGYGVYFNIYSPSEYIIFADLDDSKQYNPGELLETVSLEKGVVVNGFNPVTNELNVVFNPPDPAVFFSPTDANLASIRLSSKDSGKIIEVNKAGLINITNE